MSQSCARDVRSPTVARSAGRPASGRQGDGEASPAPWSVIRHDRPIVGGRDPAADGQAQPGPAGPVAPDARQVGERLEDPLAIVGATAHGLGAGTDSGSAWASWIYVGATVAVMLLFVHRVALSVTSRREQPSARTLTGTAQGRGRPETPNPGHSFTHGSQGRESSLQGPRSAALRAWIPCPWLPRPARIGPNGPRMTIWPSCARSPPGALRRSATPSTACPGNPS